MLLATRQCKDVADEGMESVVNCLQSYESICSRLQTENTGLSAQLANFVILQFMNYMHTGRTKPFQPNEKEMKNCEECGKPLIGRVDKKFCSDMCRNSFNNRLNSDAHNIVRNINNKLRKNRRILEELCPDDKSKTTKQILLSKGFDFNFITNVRPTLKGSIYHFVYNYGYLELDNDFYLIVRDKRLEK